MEVVGGKISFIMHMQFYIGCQGELTALILLYCCVERLLYVRAASPDGLSTRIPLLHCIFAKVY